MNDQAQYKVVHGQLHNDATLAAQSFEEELRTALNEGWNYVHATFNSHATNDCRFFYTALMVKI